MEDNTQESQAWPVNELGELILSSGQGSTNVKGYIHSSMIPSDPRNGRVKAVFGEASAERAIVGQDITLYLKEGEQVGFTSSPSTTSTITKFKSGSDVVDFVATNTNNTVVYGAYTGVAKFVVNVTSGSVTASVKKAVANTAASGLKVVLWGDSGMGNSAFQTSISAPSMCTQAKGVATATMVGHGGYVGEPINIINSEDEYWYGKHIISRVVDANTVQFSVDPRAVTDLYNSKTADGIAVPAIILSHQHGKNNPALQSMMMAGIVPTDFVNLGANSQTALSMGWHIERDLADYPDYDLWVCSTVGANDVRANGTTGNLRKALVNAKARLLRLKQAGKRVLYLGWMPNDARDGGKSVPCFTADGVTPFSSNTDTVAKCTARFHQEMANWCVENGIEYLSQFTALVDPTGATSYAVTGTAANDLLSDGVHTGKRAGRKFAQRMGVAWFKQMYAALAIPLPATIYDRQHDTTGAVVNQSSSYIFRNPLLTTISGIPGLAADCATGTAFGMPAATGFSVNPRTIATDGDTFGNNQRAVFLTTGAGADQAGSLTLTLPNADIKLGGKIRACAHVQFTGLASFQGYRMYLSIATSNYGTITAAATVSQGSGTDLNNFDDTEVFSEYPFTPWAYIPADAAITSALLIVQGFVKAVAGAGTAGFTVDVGRIGVESSLV